MNPKLKRHLGFGRGILEFLEKVVFILGLKKGWQ